jgi:tRNA G18 (ribose-2'-O)-methylase SpoU
MDDKKADKIAIILGNEVFGVDDRLLPICDGAIEIPQLGVKHSLNVSIAGAVVLWELLREKLRALSTRSCV